MTVSRVQRITELLRLTRTGDVDACDALAEEIVPQLRRIAAARLSTDREVVRATSIANDAFMSLLGEAEVDWRDRAHFLAIGATHVGRAIINAIRHENAAKRGGGRHRITLGDGPSAPTADTAAMLDLEQALEDFAAIDPVRARMVQLVVFSGLTQGEIAEVIGTSRKTVVRGIKTARAWLTDRLGDRTDRSTGDGAG